MVRLVISWNSPRLGAIARMPPPDGIPLFARDLLDYHGECLGACLDVGPRVCLQVVVPSGIRRTIPVSQLILPFQARHARLR
jgi:hypothetical protein